MSLRLAVLAVFCALLLSAQEPPAQAPAASEPKPPAAAPAKPAEPKPFAELIKGATETTGLFRLYRTEDKVYLELAPDQFERMYTLAVTCDSGIGERGFYAADMCADAPVSFHRSGKNVQVLIKNPYFRADSNTPMARAVSRSFSDSLLGAAKIESQPHPERKSVLIDLGSLLLKDVVMISHGLEQVFRIQYRYDAQNSSFGTIKGFEHNVEIETIAHFATDRLPVPPLLPPGAPAPPTPPLPRVLPDPRSMLFHIRYSLSEMPDAGFRPRLADDRVGLFFDRVEDFSDINDSKHTPARRYINRWRLEKADPTAALSKPRRPIVFWLENTIPVKYRDAIRDGVLLWNKAFERIGFQDAVEVRQQPDDADWDAGDIRYSTIRWFAGIDAGFAQGPSRTNPFTGEIYDADIRFSEAIVRGRKQELIVEATPIAALASEEAPFVFRAPWSSGKHEFCTYGGDMIREAAFSFDVLETRGIDPDGPEGEKLVQSFLREISAHEVGHTLGLRHNFRASTIRSLADNQNAETTMREGLTGSVMDYIPTNLAERGAKQGEYHQSTLGPYDYWAIEYAYKPIDAPSPESEVPQLAKIASRVAEANLAYATDEDAGFGPVPNNMDPLANRFDLGSDPLQWYAHRIKLSNEVFANMEAKLEKPGEGYQVLRRSFNRALIQSGQAMIGAAKNIGGVYYYRDHIGDPGGRLPYENVPAVRQKQALQIINENCFAPRAFRFSPQLLSKLSNERLYDRLNFGGISGPQDVPLHDAILNVQKAVLDRVFHPMVLRRVIDSELRASAANDRFRISDLFISVQDAVWAETQIGSKAINVNSHRRSLQREHLKKLINMMLRDAGAPEDARSMSRYTLLQLQKQLQAALTGTVSMPFETRAHLTESVARIDEALRADMQRTAL